MQILISSLATDQATDVSRLTSRLLGKHYVEQRKIRPQSVPGHKIRLIETWFYRLVTIVICGIKKQAAFFQGVRNVSHQRRRKKIEYCYYIVDSLGKRIVIKICRHTKDAAAKPNGLRFQS